MKKYILYLFTIFSLTFLFSASTKAFTVYSDSNYTIDEEFIINTFKSKYSDFTLEEFPYIKCDYRHANSQYVSCDAITQELFDSLIFERNSSGNISFKNNEVTTSSIGFRYDIVNNTFTSSYNPSAHYPYYSSSVITYQLYYSNSYVKSYTNFNPSILPSMNSNYDTIVNKLDFSKYAINLRFNENLFANDENFKKVCVNENTKFAITPTSGNYSENGLYTDFIWFPYGLNNGLYKIQYDSSSVYFEGNVIIDTKDAQYENFYFSNIESINSFYDTDLPSDLEEAGYTDKYSYYGYNAYKFFIVYKDGLFRYPIYIFDNPSKTHISSNGNTHGGGGTRLDGDEEIEITTEYCFYIKKDYEVNEVMVDEWGDFYGSVISPDGDYDFNTSYNKTNTNSESFLSQPIKFITEMSSTITFLNTNIYNLYISMPLVVRTFLITALIIIIVMLIMKIGGYK